MLKLTALGVWKPSCFREVSGSNVLQRFPLSLTPEPGPGEVQPPLLACCPWVTPCKWPASLWGLREEPAPGAAQGRPAAQSPEPLSPPAERWAAEHHIPHLALPGAEQLGKG